MTIKLPDIASPRIAIIGLGYVGLPLAVEFGKRYRTVGFDIDHGRIAELGEGLDATGEISREQISSARNLSFAKEISAIADSNVFIITVPTPVDERKQPDFGPLVAASRAVGGVLKPGDIVIYESTVYPGATEEICVPEVASASGLSFNADFAVGYSPERINPGDKERRVGNIRKVTSGSTPDAAAFVDRLYGSIVSAGTYLASSIKVAEAAKVVENSQRDVNIALMNEFSKIFERLGIDTSEVLDAAATKWNFAPYRPGLVGGHCVGVDPYYLIQKAQAVGYFPDVLLSSRRINDAMGEYVASRVVGLMVRAGLRVLGARVLVLGFTFKENCPDLRNTKVADVVSELSRSGAEVDVYDPWANPEHVLAMFGVRLLGSIPDSGAYDAIVIATAHEVFSGFGEGGIRGFGKAGNSVVFDVKGMLPKDAVDGRL